MFVANAALATGINDLLAKKGKPRSASLPWLSMLAPVSTMAFRPLSYLGAATILVGLFALSGFWTAYLISAELAFSRAKRK